MMSKAITRYKPVTEFRMEYHQMSDKRKKQQKIHTFFLPFISAGFLLKSCCCCFFDTSINDCAFHYNHHRINNKIVNLFGWYFRVLKRVTC